MIPFERDLHLDFIKEKIQKMKNKNELSDQV